MRLVLLAVAAVQITACTANMTDPPVAGETPGFTCKGGALPSFVGQQATQDLGARMLRATGARTIRWVAKGMMVTMDFRADRLTVFLDGSNRIDHASCG